MYRRNPLKLKARKARFKLGVGLYFELWVPGRRSDYGGPKFISKKTWGIGKNPSKDKYGGLKFVQKNYGDLKIFSLKIWGCENKNLLRGHSKSTFKFFVNF